MQPPSELKDYNDRAVSHCDTALLLYQAFDLRTLGSLRSLRTDDAAERLFGLDIAFF